MLRYRLPPIRFIPSPNQSPRPAGTRVSLIVLHSTDGNFDGAVSWLCNPQSKASAHYVVDRSGTKIVKLVPLSMQAWHAGRSEWRGQRNVNRFSIGIEMEHFDRKEEWSTAQVETVALLCAVLCNAYCLTPDDIVGHADVAIPKGRKIDPYDFPWRRFRQLVQLYLDKKDVLLAKLEPSVADDAQGKE